MERKIGEIFEYNGEWYQCVRSILTCSACEIPRPCTKIRGLGYCSLNMRNDKEQVVFKKLEKVGEPYTHYCPSGRIIYFQRYKIFNKSYSHNTEYTMCDFNEDGIISIEIEQNKEDMEESVEEKLFCDKVAKANAEYMKVKLNSSLKPFDIEAAKSGKPVCTRDGRKVRIICFDRINGDYYKIVACVTAFDGDFEEVLFYGIDGYIVDSQNPKDEDLMMPPEKKEGWVNIYYEHDASSHREASWVYDKEEEAIKIGKEHGSSYIATVRIEWEE